jgi:hypothetical protein
MFLLLLFVFLLVVNLLHGISFSNTPPAPRPGDPNGGVVYLRIVLPVEEVSRIFLYFWKETTQEM